MANPQAENGHIDIANEIAEALMRTNLNSYQWRILWAIWRKTYGWHKKFDRISNSQLVGMTGIRKSHVSRTLRELKGRHIVIYSGNKIAFNKDYTQWRQLPNQVTVTYPGHKVTSLGNKKLPRQGNTKENTKETKQKKETVSCPHKSIVALYHQVLPELPEVKDWHESRQKILQARWKEKKKYQSLNWWKGFFGHVKKSKFLMGNNNRKWQPNLEWLIQKKNFINVIEGEYHYE